jgi:hypothetical protein
MTSQLPSQTLKRVRVSSPTCCSKSQTQRRNASLLKRPHRPYTFTQLITLSDGSSYLTRTTSPVPIYKSIRDTRNHPLWQPSLSSLRNIEQDDAGRLRAFRQKFGRGWDLDSGEADEGVGGSKEEEEQSLTDLITGVGSDAFRETPSASGLVKKKAGGEDAEEVKMVYSKNKEGKLVKVPHIEDKALRRAASKKL